MIHRRAAAVGVRVENGSARRRAAGQAASTAELDAELEAVRAAVEDTQQRVDAELTQQLTNRISRSTPAAPERTIAGSRLDERGANTVADAVSVGFEREKRARASTLRDAQILLTRSAAKCEPEAIPKLTEMVERLANAKSIEQMRSDAVAVAVEIKKSVDRRRAADVVAQTRTRLVSLLADALPEERERLVDAVSRADKPAELESRVHDAVHRADLLVERRRVAAVAMSALAGAGCALGDDFATLLVDHDEAVVPLPHQPDHGVLVRLAADGTKLTAAVVRANELPSDSDTAAQQVFCTDVLGHLEDGVRAAGIELTEFVRRQPGQYPVAPAPPGNWSRSSASTATGTPRQRDQIRQRAVRQPVRERQRGD